MATRLLVGVLVVLTFALRRQARTRTRLRRAIVREARHDALTGLGNRLFLRELLGSCLRQGRCVGLLFIDLDEFRAVNDTAGHHAGDELLVAVARRLRTVARPIDTVVRIGGDEFAVLCLDADTSDAEDVAARVLHALHPPLTAGRQAFHVRASIGVTSTGEASADRAELERQADIALHAAKSRGGCRVETFTPEHHQTILEGIALRRDLTEAIIADRIEVVYQPIVDLTEGRVCRLEALARWQRPGCGAVPPDVFIPLAEETGTIALLGAQVLHRACAQLRAWKDAYPSASAIGMSVNVSPVQLADPGFIDTVRGALRLNGLDASDLTVEVTEGSLATTGDAAATVQALREIGVRVAVDDFGTGHSSMGRLAQLSVNELKIDRMFIRGLDEQAAAGPLVTSILALARSLDLEVVAEGIESSAHVTFLTGQGCTCGQGYLFGRPLPPVDCVDLLADPDRFAAAGRPVRTSGDDVRLQLAAALSDLQAANRVDGPALRTVLATLADLTGLETTYLTRIDWQEQMQEIRLAHNAGDQLISEGLVVPWEEAVCRRVLAGGPMATSDAPTVFADAPAVRVLRLQTYTGVPVMTPDGAVYGTLCGASRRALPVSEATVDVFQMFADLLASHLPALDRAVPAPADG